MVVIHTNFFFIQTVPTVECTNVCYVIHYLQKRVKILTLHTCNSQCTTASLHFALIKIKLLIHEEFLTHLTSLTSTSIPYLSMLWVLQWVICKNSRKMNCITLQYPRTDVTHRTSFSQKAQIHAYVLNPNTALISHTCLYEKNIHQNIDNYVLNQSCN